MYWLAIAFGVALVLTVVTGANPIRLVRRLQSRWLVVVGIGIQVALALTDLEPGGVGFGLLMLSYALLLAFCFINVRVWGMPLVALGVAMNAVVIGVNEGMPTRDATDGNEERPITRTVQERPESDDDLLPFLGQVIPLPDNAVDVSVSPGDVAIGAGLVILGVVGGRRPRRAEEDEDVEEEVGDEEVSAATGDGIAPDELWEAVAEKPPAPAPTPPGARTPPPPPAPPSPPRRPPATRPTSGWRYEPVRVPTPKSDAPAPASDETPPELEQWKEELADLAGDPDDERDER